MKRTRWLMVFVLAVGTAFGLAGSAQADDIVLTFSDPALGPEAEIPVPEDYQPLELDGTGITTTFTNFYTVYGGGIQDHTNFVDSEALSVYIWPYTAEGASMSFSQAVQVPSVWIFKDTWCDDGPVVGNLGGQEVWRSDQTGYPDAWVEITAGAGEMIDEIFVGIAYVRFDDITIAAANPLLASNPRPTGEEVDPEVALLEWDAPAEVTTPRYDVYFGTDPTVANNPKLLDGVTAVTSVEPNDPTVEYSLAIATQYYWRVDVNDPNGGSPVLREGAEWTFTTWPPDPLILTQPENTFVVPAGTAQFTVESGGNLAGSHTFKWYKQVGATQDEPNDIVAKAAILEASGISTLTITNVQYDPDPLLSDEAPYYCKVTNTAPGLIYSDSAGLAIMRLMAWYKLNGNSQDFASLYHATKVDGAGFAGGGIQGLCMNLDGSTGYAYVPYIIAEAIGTLEDFTLAAWVNPDVDEEAGVILAGYDDSGEGDPVTGGDGISIERTADGGVLVRTADNTPETVVSSGTNAIPEDEWTYVVFVYDSNDVTGTGTLYINGEQDAQVEYSSASAQQVGPFTMGAYRPDGYAERNFLDGQLDEVRIYAYAISPVNVASLYNEMSGESACSEYHEFDLNGSCAIELADYAKVLSNWLGCHILPIAGNCP